MIMKNNSLIKKNEYHFSLNKNINDLNYSDIKFIKENYLNKKIIF